MNYKEERNLAMEISERIMSMIREHKILEAEIEIKYLSGALDRSLKASGVRHHAPNEYGHPSHEEEAEPVTIKWTGYPQTEKGYEQYMMAKERERINNYPPLKSLRKIDI